ncbi:arylsulfatase [Pelagibius sp.]|uniref:arylsulfatase n=1 Tax=Pelagibius sp. TaxID=1931238 RepID=UPI00262B8995|nr:arylsulfatase [Pelagibius sp.]
MSQRNESRRPLAETLKNSASYPRPEPAFRGQVGRTFAESRAEQPEPVKAPEEAPNVVVILLDDVGFAQFGTFGGLIPSPALDRLAAEGLSYNRFHTTAICSPTRAAMLTGRNAHVSGNGAVTEMSSGFPGYNCAWPKSVACIAEILRQNGYGTCAIGKWHNTPNWESGPDGPFDRWPTGLGFEYFYGFVGGATNQWKPTLFENTRPVRHRAKSEDYHLTTEMTDKSLEWVRALDVTKPDKPFFLWYAPGATHAPHHVSKDWIEKFEGRFDDGWDVYREEAFRRQKKLGVIPQDAKLTPRPEEIPAWDTLSDDERRLFARMMKVFAAFTAQTDHEIGRLMDGLEEIGKKDNTLVLYVVGDNGASGEGGLTGNANGVCFFNGVPETIADMLAHYDALGGPDHYNHFPAGWAWAMNTPFKWVKRVASHLGGVRNPLVVSWPKRIADKGALRTQFHHAIDIFPTVLDAAGIAMPVNINGAPQRPIDGVSMVPSFDNPDTPETRKVQYFEAFSNRAIYDNGWWAGTREVLPWKAKEEPLDPDTSVWELYQLEKDFSQAEDLAAERPDLLRRLQDLFWIEAAKNQVLPLDARGSERIVDALALGKEERPVYDFYPGIFGILETSAPDVKNRSFALEAEFALNDAAEEGVIVALGGRIGGYALLVRNRKLEFLYNFCGIELTRVVSAGELPLGDIAARLDFDYDGGGLGKGGDFTLSVGGETVARQRIERTVPRMFARETLDIGLDLNSPVGDYEAPFEFTGTLKRVRFHLAEKDASASGHGSTGVSRSRT